MLSSSSSILGSCLHNPSRQENTKIHATNKVKHKPEVGRQHMMRTAASYPKISGSHWSKQVGELLAEPKPANPKHTKFKKAIIKR
jgi:hypothetical protein